MNLPAADVSWKWIIRCPSVRGFWAGGHGGGALGVWACVAVVEVGERGRFRICFQGEASGITDGLDGMPERGHPEGWGGLEPREGA